MEPKQQPPYPLRMPPEMRAHLEDMAEAAKRSLNAEIVANLTEIQSLRNRVESMSNELRERDEREDRVRELLFKASAVFGLFQGRLREAKAKLTADETDEVSALLSGIQEELKRPEPVEALFERARELHEEALAIRERLIKLGAEVQPEADARLSELESIWKRVKQDLGKGTRASKT